MTPGTLPLLVISGIGGIAALFLALVAPLGPLAVYLLALGVVLVVLAFALMFRRFRQRVLGTRLHERELAQ